MSEDRGYGERKQESGGRGQRSELTFIDRMKIYNEETMVFRFEILRWC